MRTVGGGSMRPMKGRAMKNYSGQTTRVQTDVKSTPDTKANQREAAPERRNSST